jgi:hypothetical protein
MRRTLISIVIFIVSLITMIFVFCMPAWYGFVNGKLYLCTDGFGILDFWFAGDWVHHPIQVKHVVFNNMSDADEIKEGWSMTGLWCLWGAFILVSAIISTIPVRKYWLTTKLLQNAGME